MDEPSFKDAEDEYSYHLVRAEYHARHAVNLLNETRGPKRSIVCRTLLVRAQGILLGLYSQESRNRKQPSEPV